MLEPMESTWRQRDLPEIVTTLARRPGHESVRTLVADILRYGFDVAYHAIDHEVRLPEVHGRADTLFGSVVFEFKTQSSAGDLDARSGASCPITSPSARAPDAAGALSASLTDGAEFIAYELTGVGALRRNWPAT